MADNCVHPGENGETILVKIIGKVLSTDIAFPL